MKRLIFPVCSIALLLIIAAAITYTLGWRVDPQIDCVAGKGCRTDSGMILSALWGIVAVGVVVIWNRARSG